MKDDSNLIWIDLEMTGLDTDNDQVIEIATIVTDAQLNVLAEGPIIAIHQSDDIIDGMDEWNTRQHNGSGLVKRVKDSRYTESMAEAETIAFLEQYVGKGQSPMCGNSICQDRRFMARCMPVLEDFFHYRNLDVSSLKEMIKRWGPEKLEGFEKSGNHLAMDDIIDSINELKHYRQEVFNI